MHDRPLFQHLGLDIFSHPPFDCSWNEISEISVHLHPCWRLPIQRGNGIRALQEARQRYGIALKDLGCVTMILVGRRIRWFKRKVHQQTIMNQYGEDKHLLTHASAMLILSWRRGQRAYKTNWCPWPRHVRVTVENVLSI